jgi:hypothetical protein
LCTFHRIERRDRTRANDNRDFDNDFRNAGNGLAERDDHRSRRDGSDHRYHYRRYEHDWFQYDRNVEHGHRLNARRSEHHDGRSVCDADIAVCYQHAINEHDGNLRNGLCL